MCLVFPLNINLLTADDEDNGRDASYQGHTFTWREAESWDRSYDPAAGIEWYVISHQSASNGNYTMQITYLYSGEYAEWDFDVQTARTYYFWVRGKHYSSACSNIKLSWNNTQIGTDNWFKLVGENWEWSNFGSMDLSVGSGTLRIESCAAGFIEVDNILITDSSTYTPSGKKVYGFTSNEIGNSLDYEYIEEITQGLSTVMSYVDWDYLEKGRAFGTEGEEYSVDQIIEPEMYSIGLNPIKDQITNINSNFGGHIPTVNLTDKLEVNNFGITIYNNVTDNSTTVVDACVRPMWNWRILDAVTDNINSYFLKWLFISLVFKISPSSYNESMIFSSSWLNKNVSFVNLSLRPRPTDLSWFITPLEKRKNEVINNNSIVDYPTFMEYFMPEFQEEYNFTYGELNLSVACEKLDWFVPQWWAPTFGEQDFLYIGVDPNFNPNPPSLWDENMSKLINLSKWIVENCLRLNSSFIDDIIKGFRQIEMFLWNKSMSFCKGLIHYDFNDDTFDMNYKPLKALPTIYINGSIGEPMDQNRDDYRVSFWLNQSWNQEVESYNVIGQINGTDSNKTVIIGCLYDSWWNQGTADSAIGVGMLLSIAKYFKDFDITPKCNLKFIAYAGEEYGLRGAYHYESKYSDENIIAVIDLNQLGFEQLDDPKLTLNIVINNESINSTIAQIVDGDGYVNHLKNTVDFRIVNTGNFSPLSDYTPFDENRSNCDTLCFVKDTGWTLHHRDGEDHSKGDVMDYYDPTDVVLTSEMILDVLLHYINGGTIPLSTGWNLVKIPVEMNVNASDIATSVPGCQSISKWDGKNQTYWTYIVGGPSAFDFPIEKRYGFFIDVNQSSNLSWAGSPITYVNYSFGPGWNLTGWCYDYSINASNLAENITDCLSICKWDVVNQTYWTYIVGGPSAFDFELTKGMGIFVDINDSSKGGDGKGSGAGIPHPIWGFADYKDSNIHADNANVTILNENTSEQIFTTVGELASGWYRQELGNLPSGWSDGHSMKVTINSTDTDIYEGWTSYKKITANDSVGNQKVQDISLSGNSAVVRDDNGTKESTVTLDNSTDEALKTFEVNPEFIEKASSAKLWIYARADGEDSENSSHKITVNNNSSCTILFDPIGTFGYSYGWQSFNITLDWFIEKYNTFSVVDAYTIKDVNDLIIGIDTENDCNRSQWKESSGSLPSAGDCEGELMMVLQFILK